jgi:hypothetical protein
MTKINITNGHYVPLDMIPWEGHDTYVVFQPLIHSQNLIIGKLWTPGEDHLIILFTYFSNEDLNSGLYACTAGGSTAWTKPPVHFALVVLEMGSQELFLSWLASILTILASQVAGITGVSHWCPVILLF